MPGTYIPTDYLPALIFMMIATGFAFVALLLGIIFRPRRPYRDKLFPYESGNPPVGEPRYQFNVKFYITAILFVIFDVEAVFLYPWAVSFNKVGITGLIGMALFIAMLIAGFLYEWKKGALEWD